MYIGATGMQAQQLSVDTVANNIVNANTPGFKKGRVSFTDLMMREAAATHPTSALDALPLTAAVSFGTGVGVNNISKSFELGTLIQTGSAYDVAIQGEGFIEISMPDGSRAFSRGGPLKINSDGQLVTQTGNVLKPGISVPANAQNLTISADGSVSATIPGQTMPVELGELELVRFVSPVSLQAQGDNLYRPTNASGEPLAGKPGQDGMGSLVQGFTEGSNVKMVDEMVNLMVAQRAYEASVKVVQASDEMLGMVNALRK